MPQLERTDTLKRESKTISLRVPGDQLAEIDQRAEAAELTRTEFMIRSALGESLNTRSANERFAQMESRLERLERNLAPASDAR